MRKPKMARRRVRSLKTLNSHESHHTSQVQKNMKLRCIWLRGVHTRSSVPIPHALTTHPGACGVQPAYIKPHLPKIGTLHAVACPASSSGTRSACGCRRSHRAPRPAAQVVRRARNSSASVSRSPARGSRHRPEKCEKSALSAARGARTQWPRSSVEGSSGASASRSVEQRVEPPCAADTGTAGGVRKGRSPRTAPGWMGPRRITTCHGRGVSRRSVSGTRATGAHGVEGPPRLLRDDWVRRILGTATGISPRAAPLGRCRGKRCGAHPPRRCSYTRQRTQREHHAEDSTRTCARPTAARMRCACATLRPQKPPTTGLRARGAAREASRVASQLRSSG